MPGSPGFIVFGIENVALNMTFKEEPGCTMYQGRNVSPEGFNNKTTAGVAIANCLNEGVHLTISSIIHSRFIPDKDSNTDEGVEVKALKINQ